MDFKQKLKDVPTSPGVYLMLDVNGEIIYVGKAKNLRNRLRQYFNNSSGKATKVLAMLQNIVDFRYIICASEVDALVTENNLIKKHTPRYNILLKDDKAYPFLRIDMREDYPSIKLVRSLKNDGAKYFGPYMQSVNVREIFDLIHTAFNVRDCSRDLSKTSRPCLNYHLGKCLAPCSGKVSPKEYKCEIYRVIAFLRGNDKEVEKVLKSKMEKFAQEENFEVALGYRDKLKVLNKLVRKQVSAVPRDFNLDIFASESNGIYLAINMLIVRGGKLVGGENKVFSCGDEDIASFLFQHYQNNQPLCDEIILDFASEAVEDAINQNLDKKIKIAVPKQGVRKQLLEIAHKNASDALEKHGSLEDRKYIRTKGAVKQLQELLNLENLPNRIEAYDISHISGTDKVSSMVVFEGGKPKKSHYRKFRIKTVEGNNDFASMKETLTRRVKRLDACDDESFKVKPDLILIDGGKGQLSSVLEIMDELNRHDLEILSLAKREEEVFLASAPTTSILLPKESVALQLLQRVRDEAHRFAITYHRSLRSKHLSESMLLKIDGIGKKKTTLLLKSFGSVEDIKRASIEDISKIEGFSDVSAKKLLDNLSAIELESEN